MAVAVHTEVFEGPFDLLLHLILRDQVELYDINLTKIVDEYLRYMETLDGLDLEVTTEFLLIAATMGAGRLDRFLTVALPLSRRGFLSAAILVFAHTVGEFGVVLMIGGNIPGKTEVLSTRIYQLVESLQFGEAHRIAALLILFSFAALFALLLIERRIGSIRP